MTKPRTAGMPTTAEITARLEYDPDTGIFTWIAPRHNRLAPGSRAGQLLDNGYRSVCINRRFILEHRLAWFVVHGYWPAGEIDHTNRARADNRIADLREVTSSQNSHNTERRAQPSAGERGLVLKAGRWCARISFEGEEIFLGSHDDREVARLTRALAKQRAMRGLRPQSHADFKEVREAMKRYAARGERVDADTGEILEATA